MAKSAPGLPSSNHRGMYLHQSVWHCLEYMEDTVANEYISKFAKMYTMYFEIRDTTYLETMYLEVL